MKNFEAISASLYPYDVDPFLKEKACIDEGIDTQADYTYGHEIEMYTVEQGEKRDKRQ